MRSVTKSTLLRKEAISHYSFLTCRGVATSNLRGTAKREVPLVSYTEENKDRGKHSVLGVDGSKSPSNPAIPSKDVRRDAVAFDRSSIHRMTPTMRRFTLEGKVAVVTGGARGLGWNMSQALAEAGAKAIALLDVKQDLGAEAAAELHRTTNIPVQFYKVDVRDAQAISEVVAKIANDLGSVDIVINSAGVVDSNIKAETYDATMFRHLIDINLTGSFLVSQACARTMIHHRTPGSIIFLSSIAGSRVLHPQQQCAYNASKAAVIQLMKSLAAEWAPHRIRVNAIAPGYMDTALNREALLEAEKKHWCAMTPMGRLGLPDELNGLAVFLASDAAGFVTGADILADGGYAVY